MPTKLPNKLSALIRIALHDLTLVENNRSFKIDMKHYLWVDENEICNVCFAGAVMVKTLHVEATPYEDPGYNFGKLSAGNQAKMDALDCARTGEVDMAISLTTKNSRHVRWPEEKIVEYDEDPDLFKSQMADLADRLEAHGY